MAIPFKYPKASFFVNTIVVFIIKENHYRLIMKINYSYQITWMRFTRTDMEYDKITSTVEFFT